MQVITSCLKGICLCSSHFPLKHTKNINNTHPFLTQPPPVLQFLSASGDLGTGEMSLKFSNCNSKRGKTTTPCGHIQHYSFSRRLFCVQISQTSLWMSSDSLIIQTRADVCPLFVSFLYPRRGHLCWSQVSWVKGAFTKKSYFLKLNLLIYINHHQAAETWASKCQFVV